MANNFQRTVNLRDNQEAKRKPDNSKDRSLEQIYRGQQSEDSQGELQKINQPVARKVNEALIKRIVILIAILLIAGLVYWLFFRINWPAEQVFNISQNWYAVKLVNGDIFYGQINNTAADPVMMSNVYYNYDQVNGNKTTPSESGNLRLVKRGKETHGPSGAMNVVRAQILYLEPLAPDSKVLKAILDYEQ